jgi:hypothetical protein
MARKTIVAITLTTTLLKVKSFLKDINTIFAN